jgi:hypothetical protein
MKTPVSAHKPCIAYIKEMVGQGGRDWTQPITARGNELAAVIKEAQAAGFHAHRMKVSSQAVYELQFWKLPTAQAGSPPEISKESFSRPNPARSSATPAHI